MWGGSSKWEKGVIGKLGAGEGFDRTSPKMGGLTIRPGTQTSGVKKTTQKEFTAEEPRGGEVLRPRK